MAAYTNKHGVEVKKGQVWKDCDKRQEGRYLKVVEVIPYPLSIKVKCVECDSTGYVFHGARIRGINLARFHKHSTGYDLEKDVENAQQD